MACEEKSGQDKRRVVHSELLALAGSDKKQRKIVGCFQPKVSSTLNDGLYLVL